MRKSNVFEVRVADVAEEDFLLLLALFDGEWSRRGVRTAAMLPLVSARVGTAGTDRTAWVRRVGEGVIRRVLPIVLRNASAHQYDAQHRDALESAADRCESEGTMESALAADDVARAANHDAAWSSHADSGVACGTACTATRVAMRFVDVVDALSRGDAVRAASSIGGAIYIASLKRRSSGDNPPVDAVLLAAVDVVREAYASCALAKVAA